MNQPTRYGQAQSEKMTEENQTCRQIIKEINNYGVSERQRILLIYLLALEVENVERMRSITALVRDLAASDIFVSGNVKEEPDGSIDV